MNNFDSPTKPKKHLLRETGGPLVSQKQFREWGVNPSMLKTKENNNNNNNNKYKAPTVKEQNPKQRLQNKRTNQYGSNTDSFRKTTSNLPRAFKKGDQRDDGDMSDGNSTNQFHSKSFVLPRRVTARVKLNTIKERWTPSSKEKRSLVR